MLENAQYRIKEKQNFIMRTVHTVQHAAKVVEVPGVGVEVEVGVGHDLTLGPLERSQDQDLVLEVLIIVGIEVAEV